MTDNKLLKLAHSINSYIENIEDIPLFFRQACLLGTPSKAIKEQLRNLYIVRNATDFSNCTQRENGEHSYTFY